MSGENVLEEAARQKNECAHSFIISRVLHAKDTATLDIGVEAVLEAIRTGGEELRGQIEQIRNRFEAELEKTGGDLKAAKLAVTTLKKTLPAVMWCGQFCNREHPAADKLQKHSGLFIADLDGLGDKLPETRKKLEASPHVFALFLSPTGHGLKAVVRVPADASKHAGSFRAVEKHVRDLTGIQIDKSGKDVSRLCFMSYDPQLYHNPNATELEPLPEPEKPKPAFNSSGEVNLSERQRIAAGVLGNIGWQSETSGFVQCPGKHLHTTGDGERDCKIDFDGAPTLHCFHNSCRGIMSGINHELRSRIGKAEFVPAPNIEQQPGNGEPVEPPPPPSPYVPPPLTLLPSQLQEYIHAAAGSLNVDVSFIFLPQLSALGNAIGNSRSIILKRGFVQPPVIWTGLVSPTGTLKSPGLEAGSFPMLEHERELKRQNQQAVELFEEDHARWKSENSKKRGPEPEKPVVLTCLMDDLTLEVLSDRLAANPRGVLIVKDEISHWFASFDQYKSAKGSDVSRWLSLHTAVFLAVDRLKDNRHHRIWIPRTNITGGIQPKVLRRVLTEEFFERGLPARFLFAYPETKQSRWSEETVSDEIQNGVRKLFANLWLLQPEHDEHGQARPKLLPLDDEAKQIFVAFYNQCGAAAVETDEHEAAAWCKLSGYAARLALVGQLARDPNAGTVTGDTMKAACELASWFGNEAVRIYARLSETPEQWERRELIEFIGRRGCVVYEREVMQSFTRLKNNKLGTERELTALVKDGLGEWEPVPTTEKGGRPAHKFHLLRSSTSTQPHHLPGNTRGSVDVDSTSSQKNTPSWEPDKEAETLVGDESGVARL